MTAVAVADQISVGLLVTPYQRPFFSEVFRGFTEETGIRVRIVPRLDSEYKQDLPTWINAKEGELDVLYWQAGHRLFQFAAKDLLLPVDEIWEAEGLDNTLDHVKRAVQFEGSVYGIPYSYYQWGLYYNKPLVKNAGGPAKDWDQFMAQCEEFKRRKIDCIGIGTEEFWPSAGWFDYVNLRINGMDYHLELLQGKIPFTDSGVREVLQTLKEIVDRGYFNTHHTTMNWDELMPLLFRKRIAYTLIGNFIVNSIPEQMKQSVGFTPFPKIKYGPIYEEAPVDLFMIPANSPQKNLAKVFLKYMAKADTQTKLNQLLGYLPPNKQSQVSNSNYLKEGAALLSQTKAVSQYFDRDTVPEFEKKAVRIFTAFLDDGDIAKATEELEAARISVFGP